MSVSDVLVVGNGMVGQRFVERLLAPAPGADAPTKWRVTVVGEESRPAYDRVKLSAFFDGATEEDLRLTSLELLEHPDITWRFGERVTSIDTTERRAVTSTGEVLDWDDLVLATGSRPFVPPIPGHDRPGVFVYRTLDDLEQIAAWAADENCRVGAVIGGGLLGLEAANALKSLGLEAHVVEMAPWLMAQQLDEPGGAMLARWITDGGTKLHLGASTASIEGASASPDAPLAGLAFADGSRLGCEILLISAGIRPVDELGRDAGLALGSRGGIAVDDHLATSAPHVWAIGEVAAHQDRCYGLVGPGWDMAAALARRLNGDTDAHFAGADLSTRLKLMGVDVATFGDTSSPAVDDPDATELIDETDEIVFADPIARVYRRLVVDRASGSLLGGSLVGDASGYDALRAMAAGQMETPADIGTWVIPESSRTAVSTELPDAVQLCTCNAVSAGDLRSAIDGGCHELAALKEQTTAGLGCAGCVPAVTNLLHDELRKLGVAVSTNLCEHFAFTRQELYSLIRMRSYTSWGEVIRNHGTGLGCVICRPVVASILASQSNGYVLDGDQASLQDTNDHALANMQRNGTYSVVPRVPGGEITPRQLIALGQIAEDFSLYTKITGGQRIDLFGAQLHELPLIWERVIAAGMESGHAYGKSLRTVKSCVGSDWCRYGVQDSVGMAIALELRYRGLRAPHKIKMGVSGCTRECAEAQSKDVGIIATERGWNLYVAGNGGKTPRHADLLAVDLSDDELISAIDRFLMFYIRTADRLERTSVWMEKMDGGLDHVREVVLEDSLGLAAELDAEMARHVDTYACEWTETLADPNRQAHFVEFVNAPETNSSPVWITKRGQRVPAPPEVPVAVLAKRTPSTKELSSSGSQR